MAAAQQESSRYQHQTNDQTDSTDPILVGNQLIYAGRECYLIPKILKKFKDRVNRLDLSYNCIRDLDGLDEFSNLEELVLDNNEVSQATEFPKLHALKVLSLCKNKITDLYAFLDCLEGKVPNINFLSLLGNPACPDSLTQGDCEEADYVRYRKYVVYKFPMLKFLDSSLVTAEERKEAKRTGPFLRVVKPQLEESISEDAASNVAYNPLPPSASKRQDEPKGTFGKTKYVYQGRHSEGNRFIRNSDL